MPRVFESSTAILVAVNHSTLAIPYHLVKAMATSKACGSSEIHHDLNVGNQLNPGDIFPRFSPTGGRYRMRGAAGFESAGLGSSAPPPRTGMQITGR